MNNASDIPVGWEEVQLRDLGEIVAGGTPSRSNLSYWGGTIPWVTPGEITRLRSKYLAETAERITQEGLTGSAAKLLPKGSVVVTSRATLGEAAIAGVPLATNQGFKSIIPNAETDSVFAYYLMSEVRREMTRLASGTTFLEISKSDFEKIRVRRPKLSEQRRIAAVLDAVDEAVARTEAVIAKLKQVRAGLLHDLLTRGLDEHGRLRDPIANSEQFRDSPLGRIPKEWETKTLSALCKHIGSGVTPRGGQDVYTTEGVSFIRSQNVTFEGLLLSDIAFIPEGIHRGMLRSEVLAHDVLFNITGASIGRCCPMPDGLGRANVNQHVCVLRVPDATAEDSTYLASVLASSIGQRQLEALNTFGNRQGLNYQQLGTFVLPWPDRSERKMIADRIVAADAQRHAEEREKAKLTLLKSGLMFDLLTGRARVPEGLA